MAYPFNKCRNSGENRFSLSREIGKIVQVDLGDDEREDQCGCPTLFHRSIRKICPFLV